MAYRDGDDCPDTHPIQLPKIVMEFVSLLLYLEKSEQVLTYYLNVPGLQQQ
jgi:hypothetical protein